MYRCTMQPIWKKGLYATKSLMFEIWLNFDISFLFRIVDNKLNRTLRRNLSASCPGSATTNTSFCQLHARLSTFVRLRSETAKYVYNNITHPCIRHEDRSLCAQRMRDTVPKQKKYMDLKIAPVVSLWSAKCTMPTCGEFCSL